MIFGPDQRFVELSLGLMLILLVGGCSSATEAPTAVEPPVATEEVTVAETPTVV